MCGIISYFSNERTYNAKVENLLRNLLYVDTLRGYHSTGIIFESDGEVEYIKKAVGGPDFIELDAPSAVLAKHQSTRFIIGHNRAATLGKIKSGNAHPFQYHHITGVHNGTLRNHRTLVNNPHEVDSACLYQAIAERGAAEILPKVDGAFNLIWHDSKDNTIHQIMNSDRPYTFAKLKGKEVIIGASEKGMLKWLINRNGFEIQYTWTPTIMTEYVFALDGDLMKPKKIKHEEYKAPVYVPPKRKARNNVVDIIDRDANKDRALEFFLDSYSRNYSTSVSFYGWDSDGVEVAVHSCNKDEFELDLWYIGRAYWDGANGGSWRVNPFSIKPHPVELSDDGSDEIHICMLCTEDKKEEDVLFIDNAPMCYGCCDQAKLTEKDIDPGQANKITLWRANQ